jgi:hypothetical protein
MKELKCEIIEPPSKKKNHWIGSIVSWTQEWKEFVNLTHMQKSIKTAIVIIITLEGKVKC